MAEPVAAELGEGIRVEWDLDALPGLTDAAGFEAARRFEGELDPGRVTLVRVLGAGFDDGTALAVAATRSAGADGHGEEVVRAILAHRDAEPSPVTEALLSTEYDADGRVRRAGLELHGGDSEFPVRVAGDRDSDDRGDGEAVWMRFRLDGVPGRGFYELRRLD